MQGAGKGRDQDEQFSLLEVGHSRFGGFFDVGVNLMWSCWLWCLRGIHLVAFGCLWGFVEFVVSQILCRGMVKRAAFDVKVGRCAVLFTRKSTLERGN